MNIELRDYIAVEVMKLYIPYTILKSKCAKEAYEMADAMLKAREAKSNE